MAGAILRAADRGGVPLMDTGSILLFVFGLSVAQVIISMMYGP